MNVEIQIPVVRIETHDDAVNQTVESRTPTRLVIRKNLDFNPNLDVYLHPKGDVLYREIGHKGEFTHGGATFERTSAEIEIKFDCYADMLQTAAQKRAGEDKTDELSVLTDWLQLAKDNNHHSIIDELERALNQASSQQ